MHSQFCAKNTRQPTVVIEYIVGISQGLSLFPLSVFQITTETVGRFAQKMGSRPARATTLSAVSSPSPVRSQTCSLLRTCSDQSVGIRAANSAQVAVPARALASEDPFIRLWQKIVAVVVDVAKDFDQHWRKHRRTIDTLLLILFIFRLVFSKNEQGYATTIIELWAQCRTMDVPLPHDQVRRRPNHLYTWHHPH
jgi:hypothetical protein